MKHTINCCKDHKHHIGCCGEDSSNCCPRCIEDYEDYNEDNQLISYTGTKVISECKECGVCKDCEHLVECMKSQSIKCPLCGEHAPYKKHDSADSFPAFRVIHTWVCNECPFVGFEYYQPSDVITLERVLNK